MWVYGFFLLISSITLRHQGKDFNMEASDGMCAPKELCAATWCSCVELSGWLWTFVGLCAGLFFGINAVWGRMLFCGLLIVMGLINLTRGFRVGKQVSDHADEELNEKQKAAENAEFARGVRLRIFGMVVINLAVWFAVGGVETDIARALLACLGSLVAIASGCFYWSGRSSPPRAPPPRRPPCPNRRAARRAAAGGHRQRLPRSRPRHRPNRSSPGPGPAPAPAPRSHCGRRPSRRRRATGAAVLDKGRARPRATSSSTCTRMDACVSAPRRRSSPRSRPVSPTGRGGVARRDAGADANNADQAGAPRHGAPWRRSTIHVQAPDGRIPAIALPPGVWACAWPSNFMSSTIGV